jgi:hypothetical protein
MKKVMMLLLLGMVLYAGTVWAAAASRTINYQGRLTDLSGNPVADGTHSITVRLYDAQAAAEGASKWADTYSVQTKNGYFGVVLGSTTAFPGTVDFSQQYWIGLRVDTDSEMTPRQVLNGVPYALNIEVPVGCIMAWHKSLFTSTPTLQSNFVECNGQTLNDAESPLNGKIIPNLNGVASGVGINNVTGKPGVYLRGAETSGTGSDDQMQGHYHYRNPTGTQEWTPTTTAGSQYGFPSGAYVIGSAVTTGSPVSDGTNGGPRVGTETKPVTMTVVWIMRIK